MLLAKVAHPDDGVNVVAPVSKTGDSRFES
jgi:hypothetical protein